MTTSKVNIINLPHTAFSFKYVSNLLREFLIENGYCKEVTISTEYKEGYVNIMIDDSLKCIIKGYKADIYWTDTALNVARLQSFYIKSIQSNSDKLFKYNYAVSNSNFRIFNRLGIKVDGIIPRFPNPKFFEMFDRIDKINKEYDYCFIGKWDVIDRKNIRIALDLANKYGYKAVIVTDRFPTFYRKLSNKITVIKYGSLSDEQKAEIIMKSKYMLYPTTYEGFGMPVIEAMALGVPVIYSNVEAINEFAVGFSVNPIDTIVTYFGGAWVYKPYFNVEDFKNVLDKALELSKDEYCELSFKAHTKALEIYNKFVDSVEQLLRF